MSTPTAAFTARSERLGGEIALTLFELAVTHPVAKTWYLAAADVTVGGTDYQGLVRNHTGVGAASALAGQGGESGVTLTLDNALGTGGRGRRFMDVFAAHVDGYAEPYDLMTATLRCSLVWLAVPGDPLTVGRYLAIRAAEHTWEADTVSLTFGPDQRRYRPLPRVTVSLRRYPQAPESSLGAPVVPWFGRGLRVPLVPADADGGLFIIGASPDATPVGAVTRLWTIRPEPSAVEPSSEPVAIPVRLSGASEQIIAIAGNATERRLQQLAQRFEVEGDGAFTFAVRLWLQRASGTPPAGSIAVTVTLDRDGLPSDDLVDPAATAELDASIVATGAFSPYDIPFQDNASNLARAAFIPGHQGLWLVVRYSMDDSAGQIEAEVHSDGSVYADGVLARKRTDTDDEWSLIGRQRRRAPPRLDFRGLGYLRKALSDGTVALRPGARIGRRRRGLYVGVVNDGGVPGIARAFARFKIRDLPSAVVSARLRWTFINAASPTGNVKLIEIANPGTLDVGDWGAPERGVINTAAITPTTDEDTRLSLDVTTAYNAAKTAGLDFFAVKMQYASEGEAVGPGRWYVLGARGRDKPELVVTKTHGQDLRCAILATPVVADLHRPDALGTKAAVITVGDGDIAPIPDADILTTGFSYITGWEEFSQAPGPAQGWGQTAEDGPTVVPGGRPGSGSRVLRFEHYDLATPPVEHWGLISKNSGTGVQIGETIYWHWYFQFTKFNVPTIDQEWEIAALFAGTSSTRNGTLSVFKTASGPITLKLAALGSVSSFATAISLNTWYRVEHHWARTGSVDCTCTVTLFLGDATEPLETIAHTGTSAQILGFTFGGTVAAGGQIEDYAYEIDDVHISTTPIPSGPFVVFSYVPGSDVSVQWSPEGAASRAACIDDMLTGTPDEVTTYTQSLTAAVLTDRMALRASPIGPTTPSGGARARTVQVQARRSRIGAGSVMHLRLWDADGVSHVGPAMFTLFDEDEWQTASRALTGTTDDQNGMLYARVNGWHPDQVTDSHIGYDRDASGGTTMRVTALWANIEWAGEVVPTQDPTGAGFLSGDVYPPCGDSVRLAADIDGLVDDGSGTYTGTPAGPIERGPDVIRYCYQSADEGAGMASSLVNQTAFATALTRLADWFPLRGGLTTVQDVRVHVARIARACRSFVYLDQDGLEAIYAEAVGLPGTPVRLVQPWEHGPIRLLPLAATGVIAFPITRLEVFYGRDFLELAAANDDSATRGWEGYVLVSADDTDPEDATRQLQATDAEARYGVSHVELGRPTPENTYEWVPLDQAAVPTGVRVRDWEWDRALGRPRPVQWLEVALPRFALGWRLMDEFQLETYAAPSQAARLLPGVHPFAGILTIPGYQARRARCSVREVPRLTAEHGAEFPVSVIAQIIAWETA